MPDLTSHDRFAERLPDGAFRWLGEVWRELREGELPVQIRGGATVVARTAWMKGATMVRLLPLGEADWVDASRPHDFGRDAAFAADTDLCFRCKRSAAEVVRLALPCIAVS